MMAGHLSVNAESIPNNENILTERTELSPFAKTATSTLESIRNNCCMTDEVVIKTTVELFLQLETDQLCNWMYADYDFSPFFPENYENIKSVQYYLDKCRVQKEISKINQTIIPWSNIDFTYNNEEYSEDSASIDLYVILQYIGSESDRAVSTIGTDYHMTLHKNEKQWLITEISTSDDSDYIIDYSAMLRAGIHPYIESSSSTLDPISSPDNTNDLHSDPNWQSYTISPSRFIQYATAYSLSYNSKFGNFSSAGGDCANFASQCIWYGLGGVNTTSSISGMNWPMVNISSGNSRNWYQNGPSMGYDESHAWIHCEKLKSYIVAGGYHIEGLTGTSTAGVSYAKVGDIIQVDWENNGTFDHSFVVVGVTGTNGSRTLANITVCAHTNDLYNVLLSTFNSSSFRFRTLHITKSWKFIPPITVS